MNERLLSKVISIDNHPISGYSNKIKILYLQALGNFLCFGSSSNEDLKFVYEIWSKSILKSNISPFQWTSWLNLSFFKKGLKPHFYGFKLVSFQYPLLFDCYYLQELAGCLSLEHMSSFIEMAFKNSWHLKKVIRNLGEYFSVLDNYHHSLSSKSYKNIPNELMRHREMNISFEGQRLNRVLTIATMNAGKSTLINAIVGNRINEVASTACTSDVRYIFNIPNEDGFKLMDNSSKIYSTHSTDIVREPKYTKVSCCFNSILNKKRICLIDTPGVNNARNITHKEKTLKIISEGQYDTILFVANGTQFLTSDEGEFLQLALTKEKQKSFIFCLNQCDLFEPEDDSITEAIDIWKKYLIELGVKNPIIIPISSLWSFLIKMNERQLKLSSAENSHLKRLNEKSREPFFCFEKYSSLKNEGSPSSYIHTGLLNLEQNL